MTGLNLEASRSVITANRLIASKVANRDGAWPTSSVVAHKEKA
jgi:hypothetical protein